MRRLPPSAGEQRSGLIGTAACHSTHLADLASGDEPERTSAGAIGPAVVTRTACDGPFGREDRLVRIASTELMHAAEDRYRRRLLWRRRPRISGGCVDRARSHSTWL